MRRRIAFAAACLVAAAAPAAIAQTVPDRGFGGPPTFGPNFKTGEAFSTPDFGSGQQPRKRKVRVRGSRKTTAGKNAMAVQAEPAPAKGTAKKDAATPPVETGTVHAAKSADTIAAPDAPVPCRKFDPTTGRTIAIRCE